MLRQTMESRAATERHRATFAAAQNNPTRSNSGIVFFRLVEKFTPGQLFLKPDSRPRAMKELCAGRPVLVAPRSNR